MSEAEKEGENVFLFDMDGSLADHDGALVRDLMLIRSPNEPITDHTNLWGLDKEPHMKARVDMIRSVPGWWRNLHELPIGMFLYRLAGSMGFQNEVLTKGPKRKSLAWQEKVQWCQEHLSEDVEIHIVSNKGRVYGRVLYDDYPAYVSKWLEWRKRGLVIMPMYEGNCKFEHPNVLFWDGEPDTKDLIVTALQRVLDRKASETLDISDLKAKQPLEQRLQRVIDARTRR